MNTKNDPDALAESVENSVAPAAIPGLGGLLNQLPVGVILHDSRGTIQLFNETVPRLLDVPPERLRHAEPGEAPFLLLDEHGQVRDANFFPFHQVQTDGRPLKGVVMGLARPDPTDPRAPPIPYRWLEVDAVPSFDSEGRIEAVTVTLQDVTAQRSAQALESVHETAERTNAATLQFLQRMSHEFRTPLNAVLGFAEMLTREPQLDTKSRQRASLILAAGEHLAEMVDDVRDLARAEGGRRAIAPVQAHLPTVMQEILASLTGASPIRYPTALRILGDAARHPAKHGWVRVDVRCLRQALLALLRGLWRQVRTGQQLQLYAQLAADSGAGRQHVLHVVMHAADAPIDLAELEQPLDALTEPDLPAGAGLGVLVAQVLLRLTAARLQVRTLPSLGICYSLVMDAVSPPERLTA